MVPTGFRESENLVINDVMNPPLLRMMQLNIEVINTMNEVRKITVK